MLIRHAGKVNQIFSKPEGKLSVKPFMYLDCSLSNLEYIESLSALVHD